jgi:CRP-like cAMP-binding protein
MSYPRLDTIPLFKGLTNEDLDLLAKSLELESFPDETLIFNQGDPADKLYILVSGKVSIRFKPEDGEILTVTEVEKGGVFGWSSALGRRSYTSCAVCLADSQSLCIHGDELRRLCSTHPETGVVILERLAEVIAERLTNTHKHVIEMLRQGMRTSAEP